MLTELHIENVAVIERADIEFSAGFNVLTGETGAGKSIVIDSLGAILGDRVSRELVRAGAVNASVTAVFSADGTDAWFEESEIEAEDSIIVRRRISADGKSSAMVNGVPVSAAQLRALGALLLDIHGQNDGRQLTDESRHRDYLDGFAGLAGDLAKYRECYGEYRRILAELESLSMGEEEKRQLEDSLRYRIEELSAADLKSGEEETLSARRDLLRNAGRLTEALEEAYDALYGNDESAVGLSGTAEDNLSRVASFASELAEVITQVSEARFSLEDAAERLRDLRDSLEFSPEEYDELESRLALIRRLGKKYGADEAGLLFILEESRTRLEQIEYSAELREKLLQDLDKARGSVETAARSLTEKREAAATELQARIEDGLRELSMPSVRFEAELRPMTAEPGFDRSGADEIRFLMSANAGEKPGRISKIASGGELSRIMLVMKEVLSENDAVGTMVFDEIDAGVSGIAAQRVGEKLSRLSRQKQVICVTHLPQIAVMADGHFKIEKAERDGRTYTDVARLDRAGRTGEIARLHGGDNISVKTLASAEEQLAAAEAYKVKNDEVTK